MSSCLAKQVLFPSKLSVSYRNVSIISAISFAENHFTEITGIYLQYDFNYKTDANQYTNFVISQEMCHQTIWRNQFCSDKYLLI